MLEETEAEIYLACDPGSTPMAVWKALLVDGRTEIELEEVEDFLKEIIDLKLMYEEGGCYLSLAVATNPEIQRATGLVQAEA